jgi:hypothetical protein
VKVQVVYFCSQECSNDGTKMQHIDDGKYVINSYNFDEWDDVFPLQALQRMSQMQNQIPYNQRLPRS